MTRVPPWQVAADPASTPNPNVAPFNSNPHDQVCRMGLWLGVLSAVMCGIGAFGDRVIAFQDETNVTFGSAAYITAGAIFAVFFGCAIFIPYAWARITGIGLLAVAAFTYAVMVFSARVDDTQFVAPPPDISLGNGGVMLVLAFVAATIGLVAALVGAPRIGRPAVRAADGQKMKTQSGYAVTSLVLSLCGLVVGFTAPLGIAFAVAAFDDNTRSEGYRGGRGMAVAGLVVGIVITVISALFMAVFLGLSDPSFNEPQ